MKWKLSYNHVIHFGRVIQRRLHAVITLKELKKDSCLCLGAIVENIIKKVTKQHFLKISAQSKLLSTRYGWWICVKLLNSFLWAENGFRRKNCLHHSYFNGFFEPLSLWFASSHRNRYSKETLDMKRYEVALIFLALRRMVGWIRFFYLKTICTPKRNISSYELVVFEANRQANWHLPTLEKIWWQLRNKILYS